MTKLSARPAPERRQEIQAHANSLGITEEYLSTLVDTFYGRIRSHPHLGPIFNEAVGENWEPHLVTMKRFWSSVALNSGHYSGKPVPKHQALSHVKESDFDIWLTLFEATIRDTSPTSDAVTYLMERANRIAESLKLAMFGAPELRGPS